MAALKYVVALAALVAVLLPFTASAQQKDNAGKEFYVAFAENQGGGEDENAMELYITSKVTTSVRIQVTALGFDRTVTSSPGAITTVALPSGDVASGQPSVEIATSEQIIKGKAVHITSDEEVTVYGMNHKTWSSDAFMAIPIDVLGTEYITINYPTCSATPGAPANGSSAPGEFWLVAVNDSTNVTITPRALTQAGNPAGVPIQLLMYKGDVYLVEGDQFDYSNDLTGSLIESDQPIAVFSGHVRAAIPQKFLNTNSQNTSRDHLVEQLPPVSAWGDSALVIPYASSKSILKDLVRIVSAEDDNTITYLDNGVSITKKLNQGDFCEITSLSGPTAIHATNPIMVGQFMHTSKDGTSGFSADPHGDPALALVFPVEQFNTSYTFISVAKTPYVDNYVNVVTSSAGINGISVDGKLLPSSKFKSIPNSDFYYAQLNLDDKSNTDKPGQGTHNMTGTSPFGIIVYGLGPVDSYSYTGGSLLKTITPFKTVDVIIDFRDRLLTTKNPDVVNHPNEYINYWDSTVFLQNISSDPLTINGFANRTGDVDNFAVVDDLGAPMGAFTIGPGESKNITIRFTPKVPDIREHTKINAQTEHLRAYVVDVYGRGILGNPQVFSDSATKKHIDTLDFGTFEQTDPSKDSEVFIANRSVVDLEIKDAQIINLKPGTLSGDFSIVSFDTVQNNPLNLPFTLPVNSKSSARTVLKFTPSKPNGRREALLDITPNSGSNRQVVLLANVMTIFKPTVTNISFDTVFLCTDQDRTITVSNSNPFEISVTNIDITPIPSEFTVLTPQPPFTVPPGGSRDIIIRSSPQAVGSYSSQATISFNLPKGFSYSQPLNIVADQVHSSFKASQGVRALPNETIVFPIYAYSPMGVFKSPSFRLILSYDPTHIHDFDYDQAGTHTEFGYYTVLGDSAGYREYDYLNDNLITGGEPGDTIPLIKIKFRTSINPDEDPLKLIDPVDIRYSINFDGGAFPSACVDLSQPIGRITIDSTCHQTPLTKPVGGPSDDDIEGIVPNPSVNGSMAFTMDVSKEGYVRLDVMDAMGYPVKTLVSETYKPGFHPLHWNTSEVPAGTYYLSLRTAGGSSVRKVIVLH